MIHELMKLPYELDALEPFMSKETLEFHYGKHHQTYVNNLNNLIKETEFEEKTLIDIIINSNGAIFNNASQVFNHDFFWKGLSPIKKEISEELNEKLISAFGSIEAFKEEFTKKAIGQFGSGWAWLVKDKEGNLKIISTSNAETPLTAGLIPLLVCDVWEHAYYIDVRNARPKFLENFWNLVNWEFVLDNIKK